MRRVRLCLPVAAAILALWPPAPARAHNGAVAVAPPVDAMSVDGDLSDWPDGLRRHRIEQVEFGEPPRGRRDVAARFRAAHGGDGRYLFLAVEVTDQSMVADPGSASWDSQDGCEVFVDGRHLRSGSAVVQYSRYGDHEERIDPVGVGDGATFEVALKREGRGYTYEWRIDLDEPRAGKSIGLDVAVIDRDGDGSLSWLTWGAGTLKAYAPDRLGDLVLAPGPGEPGRLRGRVRWATASTSSAPRAVELVAAADSARWVLVRPENDGGYEAFLPAGDYGLEVADVRLGAQYLPSATARVEAGRTVDVPDMLLRPRTREDLVDELFARLDSTTPGAVVAVVSEGTPVLLRGYGMADLEQGIPATPRTVFDVASIAKQITGFAIATLAEEGRLGLDHEIRAYLSYVPDFGVPITIRQLLHHTSGLRDWPQALAASGVGLEDVITLEQVLHLVEEQRSLNFDPGSAHLYSNTGYVLLADLVRRVTGQGLDHWAREHVFAPLDMTRTTFRTHPRQLVPGRAYSYYYRPPDAEGGGRYEKALNNLAVVGSHSLYTTAKDLARWAANFETGRVGGRAVLERMSQTGSLADGAAVNYAFGQVMSHYRGRPIAVHTGGWAGMRTAVLRFPDDAFSAVVLCNLATMSADRLAFQLADIYLTGGDRLVPVGDELTAELSDPIARADAPVPDADQYAGEYRNAELEATYRVAVSQGKLVVSHARRHATYTLTPTGRADEFATAAWWLNPLRFTRGPEGQVNGFTVTQSRVQGQTYARQPER